MLGLLRRKKKDDEPVDPEERSPQLGVKYKDLLTLQQLVQHGADLNEPRHVLYFLYFPQEQDARTCAGRATQSGWQAEVREPLPDHPDSWTVVCEQQDAVTTPEFIRDATDFFEGLAGELGGECDGWEAST